MQCDELLDEIISFLVVKNGYERLQAELEMWIIPSIVSGQYIIDRKDGKIAAFLSYWKTDNEGIERIRQLKQPEEMFRGTILYITEAGNESGNMREMVNLMRIKEPQHTAIACHRNGRFTMKRQSGRR